MRTHTMSWLIGIILGSILFAVYGLSAIYLQYRQPSLVTMMPNTPDQAHIDQMVLTSLANPEVQNMLNILMLSQMRTSEARKTMLEVAHTPEMNAALVDALQTPEARKVLIANMKNPEFQKAVIDMLPMLLTEGVQPENSPSHPRYTERY